MEREEEGEGRMMTVGRKWRVLRRKGEGECDVPALEQ